MSFSQIKDRYERKLGKLHEQTNKECLLCVQKLGAELSRFRFSRITMGMGGWTIDGEKIPVVYDDRSEGWVYAVDLFQWLEGERGRENRKIYTPIGITRREIRKLSELADLLDWWADQTGGQDFNF